MRFKSRLIVLFVLIFVTGCSKTPDKCPVIPMPAKVQVGNGYFHPQKPYVLKSDTDSSWITLATGLLDRSAVGAPVEEGAENTIELVLSEMPKELSEAHLCGISPDITPPPASGGVELMPGILAQRQLAECYMLEIGADKVTVNAYGKGGLLYGIQSLIQLAETYPDGIPIQIIIDTPRFPYRGLMLDASRHFMSVDFIKKQLDAMARYKLNRFHWHLTDGAGWRLQIKRYPLLTEIAAWRPYNTWKEWHEGGRLYCRYDDPKARGGFYTADDVKDVVEYAAKLNIEVIPEIEMPGHSEEVLAVYPELSCTGKPYTSSEFCIGNEKTFEFIENVLDEVMQMFPSSYIHIGGDEASTVHWKECPKCQARIKKKSLLDEKGLQSYMIKRVEEYLNAHGRSIVGWDEILEGGLAPNATVMSWRGTQGGISAAEMGHDVIMTPGAYCYLDYYQDAPPSQPEAMPVILTAKKTYSYNPAHDSLPQNIRRHIVGVQGNLWTERMPTYEHMEYMIYPRLMALSEVAWSMPANKDYESFYKRALRNINWLREHGYNPFDLANEVGARPESKKSWKNKALGKEVIYNSPWHQKYTAAAEKTLTDGLRGDWSYSDGRWQGFLNCDFDVVIDMRRSEKISEVWAEFMQSYSADIWMPAEVIIFVSEDGVDYKELTSVVAQTPFKHSVTCFERFGWQGEANGRFVRVVGKSNGHEGGWIFTDEIFIK